MDCKKCHLPVYTKDQPFIYCNGLCAAVHHATCVGINKVELAAVSPPNKNSFWLCDECLVEFVRWRKERCEIESVSIVIPDSEPKCVLERDVKELKSKVESILTLLASQENVHADSVIRFSTPNLSRILDDTVRESTINETPSVPVRLSDSAGGDESFDLLLTNIDASVSEEDVQRMVCRCLGASDNECNNVRKLVPRWIDCSTLDFVSFKIVLDRKWKSAAMTSSTWPKNIKFREFRRKMCTWKPDAE